MGELIIPRDYPWNPSQNSLPRHAEMLGIAIMGIRNLFEGGEPTWCKFYPIKVQVGPWISLMVESWTEQTIHEFWSRDFLQTINHSRVDFHYSNGRLEDSSDIYLTWILWDWMIISPTFFRDRKPFQSFTNDFWRVFFPRKCMKFGLLTLPETCCTCNTWGWCPDEFPSFLGARGEPNQVRTSGVFGLVNF